MSRASAPADFQSGTAHAGRTPVERYREDLAAAGFRADTAQEFAVGRLQRLFDELRAAPDPRSGVWAWAARKLGRGVRPVAGIYLWGGVGRGKTYLADAFYDCLGDFPRLRSHFHRFMAQVHREQESLRVVAEPLDAVAERLARRARLILLDEFHVNDIGDAMILAGLLRALFARGVSLVTTSNVPPDDLYKNGLQRGNFLPAIALLKEHLEVIHVDGGADYRLRALERAEIYHHPLDDGADRALDDAWRHLAPDAGQAGGTLEIEGRAIPVRRVADGVVWFEFEAICGGPRSPLDYLEIARCFHSVIVSNVPRMSAEDDDRGRRFINLVDVLYDRSVKLILSADAEPAVLYCGKRLAFEFQRTASRLFEMRSRDYLARPHLP